MRTIASGFVLVLLVVALTDNYRLRRDVRAWQQVTLDAQSGNQEWELINNKCRAQVRQAQDFSEQLIARLGRQP